jgi:hypothetical protein
MRALALLLPLAHAASISVAPEALVAEAAASKRGDEQLQFVHIPKTGGSSIVEMGNKVGVRWGDRRVNWPGQRHGEDTLAACSGGCKGTQQPCSPWHLPPAFFEARKIHPNPYEEQNSFCVARHPYARAVSQYVWNMQVTMRGASDKELNEACTATRMNSQILEGLARRNASLALAAGGRTINSLAAEEDCHWLPLVAYTKGESGCKVVLNTETLAEDFDELVDTQPHKGNPLAKLPKMVHNKSEHFCKLDVSELNTAARKALAEVYAEDIEMFGYSPDAPHALPMKGAFKLNKARAAKGGPSKDEVKELKSEAKRVLQEARAQKEEDEQAQAAEAKASEKSARKDKLIARKEELTSKKEAKKSAKEQAEKATLKESLKEEYLEKEKLKKELKEAGGEGPHADRGQGGQGDDGGQGRADQGGQLQDVGQGGARREEGQGGR